MTDDAQRDFDAGHASGLADRLKHATQRLHTEAERTGFIGDVLQQRGTRTRYVLFVRNLLPAYAALEAALAHEAATGGPARALARPEVYRTDAIRSDLVALQGPGWESDVPVLAEGAAYAACVTRSAVQGSGALAGHAYTRYLGDLNGGQVLARILARKPGLPAEALGFYRFPAISDPRAYAATYRAAIDNLAALPQVSPDAIEAAAIASFRCAIALSHAVARHS